MAIKIMEYDPLKVSKIRHLLEEMAAKGQARQYEVFVDNLKVVARTEDVSEFDSFDYYMDEDTEKLRILLYNSASSPRNDQYCFLLKSKMKSGQSLSGLGDLEGIVEKELAARENIETKKKLEEAEQYIGQLEEQLDEARRHVTDTKYKLGKLDLVELGGVLLENLASKNNSLLGKIGLGNIEIPESLPASVPDETEVSFHRQTDPPLSESHRRYLPLLEQLDESFEEQELQTVMQIIRKFIEQPAQVQFVAQQLNV